MIKCINFQSKLTQTCRICSASFAIVGNMLPLYVQVSKFNIIVEVKFGQLMNNSNFTQFLKCIKLLKCTIDLFINLLYWPTPFFVNMYAHVLCKLSNLTVKFPIFNIKRLKRHLFAHALCRSTFTNLVIELEVSILMQLRLMQGIS